MESSNKQSKLEFIHFLATQMAEIDRDKWIESEKAHRDLGRDDSGNYTDAFRFGWISNNAKKYRDRWNNSKCSTCQSYNCTETLKSNCPNYIDNLRLRVISNDNKLVDVEVINIDTSEIVGRYYMVLQMIRGCVVPVFMEHQDNTSDT